jgi:hydrogenase nickel incorporation protein HypA/HybF
MHEEALLRDLRRKLEEIGRDHPTDRIGRVTLRIGALSHLTEPILRTRWAETTSGTAAAGAELLIETSRDQGDPGALGVVLASVALTTHVPGPKVERGP